MYCPNCGAQLPDAAQFCTSCGVSITTQASSPASHAVAPVYGAPSPHGKGGGKKAAVIAVAAVAALALIGAGIFAIIKLAPFSGGSKGDSMIVMKSKTQTVENGYVQSTTAEYVRNAHGDVTAVNMNATLSGVAVSEQRVDNAIAYTYTDDGYLTSITVAPEVLGSTAPVVIPVSSNVDANGRLESLSLAVPNTQIAVSAYYNYRGDSDSLSSVEYTINGVGSASALSVLGSILGHAQLPFIEFANAYILQFSAYSSGAIFVVNINEDGQLFDIRGGNDNSIIYTNANPSHEERAGQTIDIALDAYSSSATYDDNGFLTHSVQKTQGSTITVDCSYEQVADPSRAMSIFGRLYA